VGGLWGERWRLVRGEESFEGGWDFGTGGVAPAWGGGGRRRGNGFLIGRRGQGRQKIIRGERRRGEREMRSVTELRKGRGRKRNKLRGEGMQF